MTNLAAWLEKIESLHPEEMALGLDRIAEVGRKLDVLSFKCPVVMVGGTNGKGSCVKFLETTFTNANYRVGAYTSPHLLEFNERIRVADRNVSNELLLEAFQQVDAARKDIALTFFEFTSLAAFLIFKNANLDLIVLEVGLGGRLDAVNVINPNISIITSISLDHMNILGNTREAIAREKAGIMRPEKCCVIAEADPPAVLFQHAAKLNAKPLWINQDFHYELNDKTWNFFNKTKVIADIPYPNLPIQSAACALMAISLLQPVLPVSESTIKVSIAIASLSGRFQQLDHPYPMILDVAHNEASARLLAEKCQKIDQKYFAVVGMLKDKDISNTLAPLANLVSKWYLASIDGSRGASSSLLQTSLENIANTECYTYDCVASALENACNERKDETILVFGSFITVTKALQHIANKNH